MMALNFQTVGLEMLMNSTLFEENGSCGYVLKPEVLRDPAANINVFGDTFHTMVLANRIEISVGSFKDVTFYSSLSSRVIYS